MKASGSGVKESVPIPSMIDTPETLDKTTCSILRDCAEILRMQPLLTALGERVGQAGAMDYLAYFLQAPENVWKKPCLVLVSAKDSERDGLHVEDVIGAVMLFEYTVQRIGLRVFVTEDFAGRRTVVAAERVKHAVIAMACDAVMREGAEVVLVSALDPVHSAYTHLPEGSGDYRWGANRRKVRTYLYLKPSYDETLMQMGRHTRRNMRYYRRRAEAELHCRYVSDESDVITLDEVLALNRASTHPVETAVAAGRYKALRDQKGRFLVGVRAGDGTLLGVMAGRRHNRVAEVDWQINRDGRYLRHSVGTVMRSYFIREEIGLGTERIFFEGGTPHPMQKAFAEEDVIDVVTMRSSIFTTLLCRFGRLFFPKKNFLMQLLSDPSIRWHGN